MQNKSRKFNTHYENSIDALPHMRERCFLFVRVGLRLPVLRIGKCPSIGFKAGIILEKLGETGLITIAELARRLNFAADETALAAGWLARENKIYIERRNGLLYIRKE